MIKIILVLFLKIMFLFLKNNQSTIVNLADSNEKGDSLGSNEIHK